MRFNTLLEMQELYDKGDLRVVDRIPVSQEEYDWYIKEVGISPEAENPVTFNGYPIIVNEFPEVEVQGDLAA